MSLPEYHEHLFRCATGWLGWTPEVALITPMPLIELAMEGRYAYLRAVNGIPDDDATPEVPMIPANGPDGLISYLRRRAKG